MSRHLTDSISYTTIQRAFAAAAAAVALVPVAVHAEALQPNNVSAHPELYFNALIALSWAAAAIGVAASTATFYWWAKNGDPKSDPIEFTIDKLRGKPRPQSPDDNETLDPPHQ